MRSKRGRDATASHRCASVAAWASRWSSSGPEIHALLPGRLAELPRSAARPCVVMAACSARVVLALALVLGAGRGLQAQESPAPPRPTLRALTIEGLTV